MPYENLPGDNVVPFRKPVRKNTGRNKPPPGRWPPATVAFIVCLLTFLAIKAFSPWPVGLTLRHFAAATGCPAARLVKLAPAHIGDAGYWPHLDPDRKGASCATT